MAKSPAHKLGQIIGDELEAVIGGPLRALADEFGLYLDYKHARPAREGKRKVAWKDSYGNTHDLDYVLEEGGSEEIQGRPRAFIETAWRRYTKHSRNKVQEIQGAVLPLAETHRKNAPFLGALLAGDFTEGSQDQLRSHGFHVAYVTYEAIVEAFRNAGVDMSSDEDTTAAVLNRRVTAYNPLVRSAPGRCQEALRTVCAPQLDPFFDALRRSLNRHITQVTMLALSGSPVRFDDLESAIQFVTRYDESTPATVFQCYELNIRYSNGREVRSTCPNRQDCIDFLRSIGGV